MIEVKAWGTKQILFQSDTAQLDLLHIKKGGYSSRHFHASKYNFFYVLSGKLLLCLYKDDNTTIPKKGITLGNGKREYTIRPGIQHEFKALTDVECIEYAYVKLTEDIYRLNEGGIEL